MDEPAERSATPGARTGRVRLAGGLLGFALGGFFDGILLHQILQWHHLLSALDQVDARLQVTADGLFHALMYVVALVGLWQLWRAARGAPLPTATLMAAMLAGFGGWHVVDSVTSHWLLGIHRIRMDTDSPLFWDLLWMAVFGVLPLLAAAWIARTGRVGPPGASGRSPGGGLATVALVAALVAGAGIQALRAPGDAGFTTVLFLPGTGSETVFAAAAAVDARIAWTDASGELVVLAHRPGDRSALALLSHGAVAFGSALLPAGCSAWLRP